MTNQEAKLERQVANLHKIKSVATQPMGIQAIADAAGFHQSYIRQIIDKNASHFTYAGKGVCRGLRLMKLWQVSGIGFEAPVLQKDQQAIYRNQYDQLTQTPDYIDCQGGQKHTATLTHNARPSNKSPRVFAGGGVLA